MITTLAVNENNDTYIDRYGKVVILEGLDAVLQNCKTAMQTQMNEMIYAYNEGMPTKITAFDQYNQMQFNVSARNILESVEGVKEVISFDSYETNNMVVYNTKIETIYGKGGLTSA